MFVNSFLLLQLISVCFELTAGLSVLRCNKNDNNISLELTSGPVKGYCRFIENTATNLEEHLHDGNVYAFLGIPYAEAPVGANRFKVTQTKEPWTTELDATKWPSSCVQEQDKLDDLFAGFRMWNTQLRTTNLSEDCLYLNIWLPLDAFIGSKSDQMESKQPILVFFQGAGSSALDVYEPSTLVASKSIIVITVNYRLGVLGSLYSDELNLPGNQGLYDQIEALKWIKQNAFSFGGDPNRITLAGHGFGAILAGQHLFIRQSWDLFSNLILQSGNPLVKALEPISREEANKRANKLLKQINCTTKDGFDCLQNSANVFNASLDVFRQSIEGNLITELYLKTFFPPVIDNILLNNTPEELLKQGEFKKCSVLTGFTANEGSFTLAKSGILGYRTSDLKRQQNLSHSVLSNFMNEYFAYYPNYPLVINKLILDLILHEYTKLTNSRDELNLPLSLFKTNYFNDLSKIIADQSAVCPTYRFSDLLSKHGSKVYLYLYSHRVSSSPWPIWYGAVTGDELAFTFAHTIANNKQKTPISVNPWASSRHSYTNNEKLLTKDIVTYWTNFVKLNNPNSELEALKWPSYSVYSRDEETIPFSQSAQYMVFKINGTKVSRGYSLEQCKFWNSYLPNMVTQYEKLLKQKDTSKLEALSHSKSDLCSTKEPFSNDDSITHELSNQEQQQNEEILTPLTSTPLSLSNALTKQNILRQQQQKHDHAASELYLNAAISLTPRFCSNLCFMLFVLIFMLYEFSICY